MYGKFLSIDIPGRDVEYNCTRIFW